MFKKLVILSILLLTFGCATKPVYQISGVPVPDKVIQAKILSKNITITYDLSKHFAVPEGDESYRTHEFLSFFNKDFHVIKKDQQLEMKLGVFNPNLKHYIINQHILKGGDDHKVEIYNGDLSRNNFTFRLPRSVGEKVIFYFNIKDEKGNLVYESFRTRYRIEG